MLGALAGIAVAAGAGFAGSHTMLSKSQLYGANFCRAARGTRRLALTYDDGPNDPHTLHLLDVLEKHQVKATFFMVGKYVDARPSIARAVAEAGHVIGNHTYTHPNLVFVSREHIRQELEKTSRSIENATGIAPWLFRPPFGGRRPGTFALVRECGMTPVMWSVVGYDWSAKSSERIVKNVTSHIKGGDVILLHDGGHLTMGAGRAFSVQATDEILRRYKGEGYEFLTVPQLMDAGSAV